MSDLVERLRLDAEMLKDGHQKNLTQLWHSETVKDAASDAREAADEIERLRSAGTAIAELIDKIERGPNDRVNFILSPHSRDLIVAAFRARQSSPVSSNTSKDSQ